MKDIKKYFVLALKGFGMGAANVIPGVSGGTVALITGIFEELIDSIKSFDLESIKLLFKGKFKEFASHVNLWFLIAVFLGVVISIISLAKILEYLFINYPILIRAYFFGLILGSIYFVGKTVEKWGFSVILTFIVGTTAALVISFLKPATENEAFYYLLLCGIIAICSMILPGLSGSFVLILLGNYQLVLRAVNERNANLLIPVAIGAVIGLVAFSHLLSWIYKQYRNQTISTLTGFILGSLMVLWPWKYSYNSSGSLISTNEFGAFIDSSGYIIEGVKEFSYKQILPNSFDQIVFMTGGLMILGILSIWLMEKFAGETSK